MLVPGGQHPRVPGPVEGRAPEGLDGGGAAGPHVAAEGGEARHRGAGAAAPRLVEDHDGRVQQDEGRQEPRVQQREMGQDVGAERVADADDGPRHLGAEDVGQVQQVPRLIVPARVVAELALVQLAAPPLVRHVGDPDAADPEAGGAAARVQVGPERLVQLLRKPVRVRAQDRHVAGLRRGVVLRDVLLHVQLQHVLLAVRGCARPLPDVLAGHHVLSDVEGERRHGVWLAGRCLLLLLLGCDVVGDGC